jgi:cAMP phosphodiesterase
MEEVKSEESMTLKPFNRTEDKYVGIQPLPVIIKNVDPKESKLQNINELILNDLLQPIEALEVQSV